MKNKRLFSLLTVVFILMSLCACGNAKQALKSEESAAYSMAEAPAEPAYATEMYDFAEEDMAGLGASGNSGGSKLPEGASSQADINREKIIYTANAQLETTTFDETLGKLTALIESCGGFVESSSISGSNYYNQARGYKNNRSASYTFRIPCDSFSQLMSSLSSLGNVPYTSISTDNVTSQYYDVKARLEAYEAQEARLIEMMSLAETVEDIITIEDRLTEVRYEIESLQSRLNNWDRSVSYSTLYLDVSEVSEYTPVETVNTSYGEKLVNAIRSGFKAVGEFFADFLLWLLEALPTLVLLALIGWGIVALIKRRISTRAVRREKRLARREAKRLRKETGNSAASPAVAPASDKAPEAEAAEKQG